MGSAANYDHNSTPLANLAEAKIIEFKTLKDFENALPLEMHLSMQVTQPRSDSAGQRQDRTHCGSLRPGPMTPHQGNS